MSDENKESKINVEDLPPEAKELTPEEAMEVKGGTGDANGVTMADAADWFKWAEQPGRKRP